MVLIITQNTSSWCETPINLASCGTAHEECEDEPLTIWCGNLWPWETPRVKTWGVIEMRGCATGTWWESNHKQSWKNRFIVYEGNVPRCRWLWITSRAISENFSEFLCFQDVSTWVKLSWALGKGNLREALSPGLLRATESQGSAGKLDWGINSWESSTWLKDLLICETTVPALPVSCYWTHSSWRQERSNTRWNLPRTEIKS